MRPRMARRSRSSARDGARRPLRVAQICGAVDGAQWMVDISTGLIARGYELVAIIAGADGDTALRLKEAGVPFVAITQNLGSTSRLARRLGRVPRVGRALRSPVDGVVLLATSLKMARLLRRLDVDITHTHIFNSLVIGRIAGALARVPIRIAMVPGPYHLETRVTRWIDLATHRLDHRLVGGSQHIDDLYRKHGVSPSRLHWIPYAADPARFDPSRADLGRIRRELEIADSAPLIGQIAHFYPVVDGLLAPPLIRGRGLKGHEDFLAAARIVLDQRPDARFLLVGRGWGSRGEEHRRDIQRLAERLGIDRAVIFTGHRSDVPDILATVDVSVQCSLTENYGGTIESLLMSAPTIATRIGGMPETVHDEETGLLVPPCDANALAAAMLRLLGDRSLAKQLGQRGREAMLERFTTERTVAAVDSLYRELARERGLSDRPPLDSAVP